MTQTQPLQETGKPEEAAERLRSSALDRLLVSGGDPRISVDPASGMNAYGCAPAPVEGMISYASSTASTISARGWARAEQARADLAAESDADLAAAFDARIEALRGGLKETLGIGAATEVVFSPSGTDGQLLALFAAQAVLGPRLTGVVVAANETGGGTVFTARGRHFNTLTAQGARVEKNALLAGLGEETTCIDIPVRDAQGVQIAPAEIEKQVVASVEAAVASGGKVLLQAMDSSKLGCRSPGHACLKAISQRWPDDVVVLIDACQMRLSRARLARYLDDGFMVLLTGSKFFTGPPFSGALLAPQKFSAALAGVAAVPEGLRDYTSRYDWPESWPGIRAALPVSPNFGQWLRWEAALSEMQAYFAVPREKRVAALKAFADCVTRAIEASPSLELLPAPDRAAESGIDDAEMAGRTIFAFALLRDGKKLSTEECKKIYHALTRDVSALLPQGATARERELAATRCHIGQPVALGDAAALRINAGARLVTEGWSPPDVGAVIEKTELLLAQAFLCGA